MSDLDAAFRIFGYLQHLPRELADDQAGLEFAIQAAHRRLADEAVRAGYRTVGAVHSQLVCDVLPAIAPKALPQAWWRRLLLRPVRYDDGLPEKEMLAVRVRVAVLPAFYPHVADHLAPELT